MIKVMQKKKHFPAFKIQKKAKIPGLCDKITNLVGFLMKNVIVAQHEPFLIPDDKFSYSEIWLISEKIWKILTPLYQIVVSFKSELDFIDPNNKFDHSQSIG